MDREERLELAKLSNINKKLEGILENEDQFLQVIKSEVEKLKEPQEFKTQKDEGTGDGDMIVCVRVRPRLSHEEDLKLMNTTFASNPSVTVLEPSLDFKGRPKTSVKKFSVDLAFGPEDSNEAVHSVVADPLVNLALQGGICSMLSYGQTGSGKTFTMSGLLNLMAEDLFNHEDVKNGSIKLHVSYIELLGSKLSDLINPDTIKKVEVLEDKFGKVNVVGADEVHVQSSSQLRAVVEAAAGHRRTISTFKNDTSSRSHAVCKIRVENTTHKAAEDGVLFVIDLAGSENSADSQFHDKERIKESQLINTSLMTLKECIINRAKSSVNPAKHYHIPFRGSKLTLLLKDAFELESHKICRTVVFANVSPTLVDNSMTLNTLRYVAPIKEGMLNREKMEINPANPMNWDNETIRDWVHRTSKGRINLEVFCPFESGRQLLRIPEIEFIERVLRSDPKAGSKAAKVFYDKLWKIFIDARTADRKKKTKDRFKLNKDQIYGMEAEVVPDDNFYDSIIDANLAFKGVVRILIMKTNRIVLAISKDLLSNKNNLNQEMRVLAGDLAGLETISLGNVRFKVKESSSVTWKGCRVQHVDGQEVLTPSSILRVDKIKDVVLTSGSEGKFDHKTLEFYIEGAKSDIELRQGL